MVGWVKCISLQTLWDSYTFGTVFIVGKIKVRNVRVCLKTYFYILYVIKPDFVIVYCYWSVKPALIMGGVMF